MRRKLILSILCCSVIALPVANAESWPERLNHLYGVELQTFNRNKIELQLLQLKDEVLEQKSWKSISEKVNSSSKFVDKTFNARQEELYKAAIGFSEVRDNYVSNLENGDVSQVLQAEAMYINSINDSSIARLSSPEVSYMSSTKMVEPDKKDIEDLNSRIDSLESQLIIGKEMSELNLGNIPTSYPVKGDVTSHFGVRVDPIDGTTKLHQGIDIGAPEGEPVYSWFNGTVSSSGYDEYKGNYVSVSLGAVKTTYMHLDSISVESDKEVKQGDLLGYVGNTGRSTGAHLHLSLNIEGKSVDPALILRGE